LLPHPVDASAIVSKTAAADRREEPVILPPSFDPSADSMAPAGAELPRPILVKTARFAEPCRLWSKKEKPLKRCFS
jgi:hypothetical protein